MVANVYGAVNAEALITPTAVKTSAYTALPGDLVPCDISAGGFTVTLPNAPGNGTRVAVKIINTNAAATNLLTVACQGSDRINTAGGNVSFTVQLLNQGVTLQYASGIWYVTDDSLPLSGLRNLMPDWINVKAYGATGNNATDDTAAIQNAMNAAAAAGGPPIYLPAGDYVTSSPLAWTAAFPLVMVGDSTAGHVGRKAGASTIHMNFAPGHAVAISNAPWFRFQDIDIAVDGTNSGGATADYSGIYTSGVNFVEITRSQIYKNNGNFSVNSAIRLVNASGAIIRECSVVGEQSGVWQDGGSGITIEDTFITTTVGNGFGAIRMDNTLGTGAATIQLSNVVTFRGDWGFYGGGSGNSPLFIYMNNCQFNNPRQGGIYMQAGSQVWLDYVWISMAGTPAGTIPHGVLLDSGFQGWFYMENSVIQSPAGHGLWAKAGKGIVLDTTSFGGCGHGAANTYDDVHLGAAVSNVTIGDCHFDVDQYNTLNGARSAIYVEAGVTGVDAHNNQMAASGYGTGQVVNLGAAGSVRFHDNIGYNPVGAVTAPTLTASPATLTNTTGVDCQVIVSGGTVSAISVNGVATGLTSGSFFVAAGGTITITYTGAPTLVWIGS